MTRAENILASRLLEMAAAEFHEHGCNEAPASLFEGLSAGEIGAMVKGFNQWWARTTEEESPEFELVNIRDDWWMEYLASRLAEVDER